MWRCWLGRRGYRHGQPAWQVLLVAFCLLVLSFVYAVLSFAKATKRARNQVLFGAACILMLPLLFARPVAAYFGGLALNVLNMGGGLNLSYLSVSADPLEDGALYQLVFQTADRTYLRNVNGNGAIEFIPTSSIRCLKIDDTAKVTYTRRCGSTTTAGDADAIG